ncbi:MAG: hypothetical protein LH609_20830, partial [Rudanella sp.]|nr:hypothetical protein [Rudanella sp.]
MTSMISTCFTAEPVMISYTEVVTESSLRASISVGLRQLAQAIEKQEIAASMKATSPNLLSACDQVGLWLENRATTYDGREINLSWFRHLVAEELDALRYLMGEKAY